MKDAVFSWSIEQGLIYCSSSCYSGQQSSHTGLACVAVISTAVWGENSDGPAAVPIWKHMVRWNNSNILDASICLLLCTSDVVVNKKEGKLWPSFDNCHEGNNRSTSNSYVFGGNFAWMPDGGGGISDLIKVSDLYHPINTGCPWTALIGPPCLSNGGINAWKPWNVGALAVIKLMQGRPVINMPSFSVWVLVLAEPRFDAGGLCWGGGGGVGGSLGRRRGKK